MTPSRKGKPNALFGQRFTPSGPGHDKENQNRENSIPFGVDEDEEKQTELIGDNLSGSTSDYSLSAIHKPLKRSRKRKRSSSAIADDPDSLDLSNIPSAKRPKTSAQSFQVNDASPAPAPIAKVVEMATNLDQLEYYLHGRPSLNDTSVGVTHNGDGEKLYIYYDSRTQYTRELKRSLSRCDNEDLRVLPQGQTIDKLLYVESICNIHSEITSPQKHSKCIMLCY